jgi:uncharacterized protein with GYD domain
MAKYLLLGKYTAEGTRALLAEGGTKRRTAVEHMIVGMGGRLEGFYYAFGGKPAVTIIDVPNGVSAAAITFAINAAGMAEVETIPLMSAEEVDDASKLKVPYRAPGAAKLPS